MNLWKITILTLILATPSASTFLVASASEQNGACQRSKGSSTFSICNISGKQIVKHTSGLAVERPRNGRSMEQVLHRVDGSWEKLSVSVDSYGSMTQNYTASELFDSQTLDNLNLVAGLSGSNCGSPNYFSFSPGNSIQPANWWYREFNQPSTNSLYRVKESFLTWSKGINRCNETVVSTGFTSNYSGKTTLDLPYQGNPGLPNYQACLTPGPKDMVGWNWMDMDVLGRTCKEITIWNALGITTTHSSIILNQFLGWYTELDPAGCTGKYMI